MKFPFYAALTSLIFVPSSFAQQSLHARSQYHLHTGDVLSLDYRSKPRAKSDSNNRA